MTSLNYFIIFSIYFNQVREDINRNNTVSHVVFHEMPALVRIVAQCIEKSHIILLQGVKGITSCF